MDPVVRVPSSCDSNRIAWRAPTSLSLSPSLSSEGLFWRAPAFFLGLLVCLCLVADLRFGVLIFGLAVGVGFVEDLDGDAVDTAASDDFVGILVVG